MSLTLILKKITYLILYSFCLLIIWMLLKDILAAFSEYLCKGRFRMVTPHGVLKDVKCKVLKGRFPYRTIKTGNGWKNFCHLHSFREGHKIIFECDSMNPSSHIRVLLLMKSFYVN